jgi:hypothetical protein
MNFFQLILLFIAVIMTSLVHAQNNYNLFLDCATNDEHFDCYDIRESLKMTLVNGDKLVSAQDESNISLKIRTREVDEAAVKMILVEQSYQIKGDTTPILIEIKKYRESDFNVSTVTDLANHIAVHLAKLRGVVSIKSEDEGVVVVFAKDKTSSSSTGGEEKDWYLEPSGYFAGRNSVGESSTMQVGASGTYVKSQAKSKFILGAFGSFYNQRIQFENGEVENYQELGLGASTFYIRSLKNNRWSVALFTNVYSNPVRDNVDFKQQVRVGVEYNLVPFITKSEDRVFVVRYSVGPDYYNFHQVNINDQMNVWLLKHGITLASTIILNKYNHDNLPLSVSFELTGDSEVNSFRYAALSASVEVNYNITDRISLSPSYSFTFADAYVNQPKSEIGGVIGGVKNAGQFASVKHSFFITLNFAFGSPGLKNKDTRWSSSGH